MQLISSRQNELIKQARALQSQKGRKQWNLALIEGDLLIEEALAHEVPLTRVFALSQKALDMQKDERMAGVNLYSVTPDVMQAISTLLDMPDCVALCPIPRTTLPGAYNRADVLLVLEHVQDPGNVGALMRSADALGACGILLLAGCADAWNPKVLRSAMGAHFHIPIYTQNETVAAFFALKNANMYILSTGLQGSERFSLPDNAPVALVLGNEGGGISSDALELSDACYRLPMRGRAQSLNVAAAGAIMLWQVTGNR